MVEEGDLFPAILINFFFIIFIYIIVTRIIIYFWKNKSIKGKTIIIARTSLKLDQELALSLLKRKAEVIFGYSDEVIKNKIYNSLSKKEKKLSKFIKLDLLNFNSIFNFCQQVKNQCNKIDILITNFEFKKTIDELVNANEFNNKNYEGIVLMTLLLLEYFNKNEGRIINILSFNDYIDYEFNLKINEENFSEFLNLLCEKNFPNVKSAYTFSERCEWFKRFKDDYYFTYLKENNYYFGYYCLYPIMNHFNIIIDKSPLPLNLCFESFKEFGNNKENNDDYDDIYKSRITKGNIGIIIEKIKDKFPLNLDFLDNFLNDKTKFKTYFESKSNNEDYDKIDINEYNKNLIEKLLKDDKKLKLLDLNFIGNNIDKVKLIINGKEIELCEKINIEDFIINGKLEIIIKQIKPITDMSYMFNYCNSLSFITNISNLDTSKVTNMQSMFSGCEFIPNISNWDTSKVTNMQLMFSGCKYIPDISKFNTSNVKDMSDLFSYCSCSYLPDISKWDISNVENISGMFYSCSLELLPDISKWNTKNVTDMDHFCFYCLSLKYLPNISNWNTSNVKNMRQMFDKCWNLEALPDISKWDTYNVRDMWFMFADCNKLKTLPDLSKWNTKNVKKMEKMFFRLGNVESFPDISKWDINAHDIRDASSIISGCFINPIIEYRFKKKYKNLIK